MELLQSVTGEESILWMRDCLVQLLTNVSAWEKEIETSLQTCGININLSNDGMSWSVLMISQWKWIYWSLSGCYNYEYWLTFLGNQFMKTQPKTPQNSLGVWSVSWFVWFYTKYRYILYSLYICSRTWKTHCEYAFQVTSPAKREREFRDQVS